MEKTKLTLDSSDEEDENEMENEEKEQKGNFLKIYIQNKFQLFFISIDGVKLIPFNDGETILLKLNSGIKNNFKLNKYKFKIVFRSTIQKLTIVSCCRTFMDIVCRSNFG